ncbi:MAG: cytochrome c3 family protein [Desulfobulbales bacterium]|nr:cytochrome c3 family protein [Desulfobulbales bacterium]
MFKKSLILTFELALIFGLLITAGSVWASDTETQIDTGPAEMELKTSAGKKPAKFPHRKHQEAFECKECHHFKNDEGVKIPFEEGMKIKKCITCHNKDDMVNPKMNSFKLASHGLCKECHKQNKDSAPTKCSGCHIK